MTRLPYHAVAEHARRAMYTLGIDCDCPDCGETIECRVDGDDVTIVRGCVNRCETESHFPVDDVVADALARAACERASYEQHLREYDPS